MLDFNSPKWLMSDDERLQSDFLSQRTCHQHSYLYSVSLTAFTLWATSAAPSSATTPARIRPSWDRCFFTGTVTTARMSTSSPSCVHHSTAQSAAQKFNWVRVWWSVPTRRRVSRRLCVMSSASPSTCASSICMTTSLTTCAPSAVFSRRFVTDWSRRCLTTAASSTPTTQWLIVRPWRPRQRSVSPCLQHAVTLQL